ncbi:MAG: hypothetical protein D8M26_12200 [Ignavibacteriae bacterium]|jgi:hypothetical protein|nr:MAG: hypothetical protein EDM72_04340 [Chlorobiota bacterium]MBL1123633.1 hypothetical protein [Ignavibacteriota bacterium]MCE7855510.1 hypothetical protein [Ignavibacteria bacterium CHB3]GIK61361.1 MAG: hypothetical protein BroJett017_22510 [Ignavibacteriota bacterium]GJQ42217.1 MAG: hypothetical protein JETCAE03_17150 [Ignavibacteriaceae bacterium]
MAEQLNQELESPQVIVHKLDFLKSSGFISIGTILSLQQNGFPDIETLNACGVYSMVKPVNYNPEYFSPSEAKDNGNVIAPWDIERLTRKWVDDADILYYGLAGANSPRSLKSRLKDLVNHSMGFVTDRGPHKGGEIIWQLSGYENFEIWVLATGNPPAPRILEEKLIRQFYQSTGKLPFANRQF